MAECRLKLKANGSKHNIKHRYMAASKQQHQAFNNTLCTILRNSENKDATGLNSALKHTEEITLTQRRTTQNKSYISSKTWKLIEERQKAHEQCDGEEVKRLTRSIRKQAKLDKTQHILHTLETAVNEKDKWHGIKQLKKNKKNK